MSGASSGDSTLSPEIQAKLERLAELEKQAKHLAVGRANNPKTKPLNQGESVVLNAALKQHVWPKVKFVPDSYSHQLKVAKMIVAYSELKFSSIKERDAYCAGHLGAILGLFNAHRNYVMARMKFMWGTKWYRKHGKTLPPFEKIKGCLERTLDMTDKADVELFEFWWDVILPQAAGNKYEWSDDKKYYGTISEAMTPEFIVNDKGGLKIPSRNCITSSTEAFATLVFQNCEDSWPLLYALSDKYDGYDCNLAKNRKKGEPADCEYHVYAQERKIRVYAEKYRGKFSAFDAGSGRCAGWKHEGLQAFKDLDNASKAARGTEKSDEMEDFMLKHLRKKMGITAPTHQEHLNSKKGTKRKKSSDDAPPPMVDLLEDIDGFDEFAV